MDLRKYKVALEAPDITKELNAEKSATLNSSEGPNSNAGGQVDDISSKMDDIDNMGSRMDNGENVDEMSDSDATAEPSEGGGDSAPEGGDGGGEEGGEGGEEGGEGQPQEEPPPEEPDTLQDKNKVRDNLMHLYRVVEGQIAALSNSVNNTSNPDTVKVINNVTKNLRLVQSSSYEVLTKDYDKLSYEDALLKYASLKKVFELSTEIIVKYYSDIDTSSNKE